VVAGNYGVDMAWRGWIMDVGRHMARIHIVVHTTVQHCTPSSPVTTMQTANHDAGAAALSLTCSAGCRVVRQAVQAVSLLRHYYCS
jgi:hypothetical protein